MLQSILSKIIKKLRLRSVKNSLIHRTSKVEAGSSVVSSSFGRYTFCGYDCDIYFADIGSFTSIANHVVISGARHPMEWVGMSPVFYSGRDSVKKKFSRFDLSEIRRTSIGHDVWIGHSAIIISGVSIGNGAVVGAGAVVTKDVPPYGVVAGNPAKLIRYRFPFDIISKLEITCWWNLEDEEMIHLAKHIQDPDRFIVEYGILRKNSESVEGNVYE